MIETSRQLLELELTLGAQPEFAAHCPVHTDGRSTFQRVAGLGELKMKFPRTQPVVQPMSPPNMVRPAGSESFSIGLGLTNDCNLACSFCYRDPTRVDRLSLEQVQGRNGESSGSVRQSRNGTITSNGHGAAVLSDNEIRAFHDIEFSLDYPTEGEQDAQRGAGNWALIHEQAARCVRLGTPVTFISVMMKANYLRLAEIARVVMRHRAPWRVNVYQAVRSDLYSLTYEEYWHGFRALFAETDVIANPRNTNVVPDLPGTDTQDGFGGHANPVLGVNRVHIAHPGMSVLQVDDSPGERSGEDNIHSRTRRHADPIVCCFHGPIATLWIMRQRAVTVVPFRP